MRDRASISADDYPALAQFLGAYFHQDWMLDASDYRAVVQDFVISEPAEAVVHAAAEARALLAMPLDEEILAQALYDLGSYFYRPYFGLSAREWFQEIATLLDESRT